MGKEVFEPEKAEIKTWSFENFGQVLKVSGSLEPEVFPYQVSLSKESTFFKNAYDGVYKGRMVTVFGSKKGKHPIANGVMVEHMAVLAANDLGEVMISKEVFEGNWITALTNHSQEKMMEYNRITRNMPLSPGWRRFGNLHSHPVDDVLNSIILPFVRDPEVNGIGVTWSDGDFLALLKPINDGYTQDTVIGVITPVQLGFLIATSKTLEVLKRKNRETTNLLKTTILGIPPYRNFERLGVVLYAGNHTGFRKNIILQRLIY